ncbi:FAD/NAD(P)-binding protein [Mariniblastus fucicola]|uniref:FAD-dependent urate hydroxylase HpyO/Asp monooxygenase CreE-like FAD/NAD(P)-binding domain-containing protein n=1 Tax=Mariniblastus fucicola TaxID=980251 RepID=A0A5B9PED0_9BACT|nr:FAD/NAD(P)-binding domain-containing protein [Mariniblastus fucicola]QEG23859.1 hypothetical protein MFFC18_37630 [Mariniblastus fucicola]
MIQTLKRSLVSSDRSESLAVNRNSRTNETLRIGIVGCGPRGLYCLQSLADELVNSEVSQPVEVLIFEPADFPGAGNVYTPNQPAYLKMNFAAKHIDAWSRGESHDQERVPLVQWLNTQGESPAGPDDFVPRRDVGRYLHDCFQRVISKLRSVAEIKFHRDCVDSIEPEDRHWILGAGGKTYVLDQVVITVGHGGEPESAESSGESTNSIPVFPVNQNLNARTVQPNSRVAIRGFGLTSIDAVLAMTEGRGGQFKRGEAGWEYERSGDEPAVIMPYTRSGRPMLSKPDETIFVQPVQLEEIWARGRAAIDVTARPVTASAMVHQVWQSVTEAASSAVNFCSGRNSISASSVKGWFDHWCRQPMQPYGTLAAMQQSYAVSTGQIMPDIAWALGAAWRNLYPAIARCVSHEGLLAEAWPVFNTIGIEMERIAFGPPAENQGKMLALVRAGILDLNFITASMQCAAKSKPALVAGENRIEIDHHVNAVLPSPLENCSNGPVAKLLSDRIVQRIESGGGIHVDRNGNAIHDGTVVEGLAIFGRITEGCVLGNDTLSRKLHRHPDRWAKSIVEQIKQKEMTQ